MSGEWVFLWRAFWIMTALACSGVMLGYIGQIVGERREQRKREADLAALKQRLEGVEW